MMRFAPPSALLACAALLPALAACSDPADKPVEAVSPAETQALDEAAEMLEQRRLPPGVVAGDERAGSESDAPTPAAGADRDTSAEGRMPADARPQESGGPEPLELPQ